MAQELTLYQICPQCNGDGLYAPAHGTGGSGDLTCNWMDCAGTGYITFGKYTLDPGNDDLTDGHGDLSSEHSDLSDEITAVKEVVDHIKTVVDAL